MTVRIRFFCQNFILKDIINFAFFCNSKKFQRFLIFNSALTINHISKLGDLLTPSFRIFVHFLPGVLDNFRRRRSQIQLRFNFIIPRHPLIPFVLPPQRTLRTKKTSTFSTLPQHTAHCKGARLHYT